MAVAVTWSVTVTPVPIGLMVTGPGPNVTLVLLAVMVVGSVSKTTLFFGRKLLSKTAQLKRSKCILKDS